jgi:hypothetical protein
MSLYNHCIYGIGTEYEVITFKSSRSRQIEEIWTRA